MALFEFQSRWAQLASGDLRDKEDELEARDLALEQFIKDFPCSSGGSPWTLFVDAISFPPTGLISNTFVVPYTSTAHRWYSEVDPYIPGGGFVYDLTFEKWDGFSWNYFFGMSPGPTYDSLDDISALSVGDELRVRLNGPGYDSSPTNLVSCFVEFSTPGTDQYLGWP